MLDGTWNLSFLRHFDDWEVELVSSFLVEINRGRVVSHLMGKIQWEGDGSGCSSMKMCFNMLEAW